MRNSTGSLLGSPYAMLLIAVEITGIIIVIKCGIVENLSFIGYDKGIKG